MGGLYMIPERENIRESVQLSEEYGAQFEYNDFFSPAILDEEKKKKELIDFYCSLTRNRDRDMLHGAFLDVTPHSEDAEIRKVSEYRVRQSMDIALRLGVRGVVFHTNFIPNFKTPSYMEHWVCANEAFYRQLLTEYPALEILVENMFDTEPVLLAELAGRMREEKRFGVCLDYAHMWAFGVEAEAEDWMSALLPYTHHIHINDNDLKVDLHQAVGEGKIDWSKFDAFMRSGGAECSVLIETRTIRKQRASLEFMKKNAIYPFSGV